MTDAPAPPRRAIARWEGAGAVFTAALGSALHFAFEASGCWPPLALLGAVNEPVWEHLKLAFWPALAWAGVERAAAGVPGPRLWAARGIGTLVTAVAIVAVFHAYTRLLGGNHLALDIGLFLGAVALGHAVSARLMARGPLCAGLRAAGRGLLALQIAAYAVFTLAPPPLDLFADPRNGLRGVAAGPCGAAGDG